VVWRLFGVDERSKVSNNWGGCTVVRLGWIV
jgi:hypothetical protein